MKKGIIFMLFLILLQFCYGFGVSPGKQIFPITPGRVEEYNIIFFNQEPKKSFVEVNVTGPLKDYIKINQTKFIMVPGSSKSVRVRFVHPEKFQPGLTCSLITGTAYPEEYIKFKGKGGIIAIVAVASKLCLNVPYPGKYIDFNFNIIPVDVGSDSTVIKIDINSLGTEIIKNIYFIARILKDNDTLGEYKSEIIKNMLPGVKDFTMIRIPVKNLTMGEYRVVIKGIYDNKSKEKEGKLIIGYPDIELVDYTKSIPVNTTAVFELMIRNKYTKQYDLVYADIFISSNRFTTSPTILPGLKEVKLLAHVNTKNLKLGKEPVKIIVHFGNKTKTFNVNVNLVKKITNVNYRTVNVIPYILFFSALNILILVIVILLLMKRRYKEGEL